MELRGEIVMITGAGRGIGAAVAHAFARAGASLFLLARTKSEIDRVAVQCRQSEVEAVPLVIDIRQSAEVRSAVAKAIEQFGRIDVLVNCAGVQGPIGLLVNNDLEAWGRTIEINLMGTVHCLHAVLPHMIARRKGAVVNFSGGGAVGPFPRFSAYAASKAAVVRLTETVAREVEEYGIRVNAIAPGAVVTRMQDEVLAAGESGGTEYYARIKRLKETGGTPPQAAAELALFLASRAAEGVTGRLISAVWDDWKKLPAQAQQLNKSNMFTLRRIDGRNFVEVKPS